MARSDHSLSLSHLQALVAYHEDLLRDRTRNEAFLRALRGKVRPGSRVLDVGSGTGVWAVAAARLGAARVVAVEREALLCPLIERVARENGVGDRVEVVHADFKDVRLRREFDLVVSETVGNVGLDEDIVPVMRRARARFLKRDGALLPEEIAFRAAPVCRRDSGPQPIASLPRLGAFTELAVHFARPVRAPHVEILAPPRDLARIDLRRADTEELPTLRGRWTISAADRVNGLAVWLRLRVAPRVWLETHAGSAWYATLFPLEPFAARNGRLTATIDLSRSGRWTVALETEKRREVRDYRPEFAYGSLRAAVRATIRS